MNYKYLIVGCGISGAVIAERIANILQEKVLIIDKRQHIAGNIYDYTDANGISVHKYGPHAFHTNNKSVWDYLSNFTGWHIYFHKVKAVVDGKTVDIPFNFNTLYDLFPAEYAKNLETKLIQNLGINKKIFISDLKNNKDEDIKKLGEYIFEKIYAGYSFKQWGIRPEELDKNILNRVPVNLSKDNRYFQDKYQGIPLNGYTDMIQKILDNPLIDINLSCNFKDIKNKINWETLIYTGPIDEFFEFKYGQLTYRSLDFKFREIDTEYFQTAAQVNYSENFDFTRITEFKHFNDAKSAKTAISYEYPQEYLQGKNEAYYPVANTNNAELYQKYKDETPENVVFLGRLAEYKYINMDQAVENALNKFNEMINR